MRRILLLIASLGLVLTGCNFYYEEGSNNIVAPKKTYYTMDGAWELEDVKNAQGAREKMAEIWDYVLFKENLGLVGNVYSENISYSNRLVDATDYLLYKHRTTPEFLGIEDGDINIINIYSDGSLLTEVIKLSDTRLIFNIQDKFLYYKKISDGINKEDISYLYTPMESNGKGLARGNVGIVIGLKSLEFKQGRPVYKYRTEYLVIKDETSVESYSKDQLLLPRKNGFYRVEVEAKDLISDNIYIEYLDHDDEIEKIENSYIKNILYIGNDYMSVENIGGNDYRNLRLYPIDYLGEQRYRKLQEILDEKSYDRVRLDIENNPDEDIKNGFKGENFGLRRKNGYWTLFARVNLKDGDKNTHKDFNIRAVTPKTIVNYDELPILWNVIDSEIPDIVDGFISPKKDYLVARTKDEIKVYPIYNGQIDKQEIFRKKIGDNEEIIMAEWATNIYTDMWKEYFK